MEATWTTHVTMHCLASHCKACSVKFYSNALFKETIQANMCLHFKLQASNLYSHLYLDMLVKFLPYKVYNNYSNWPSWNKHSWWDLLLPLRPPTSHDSHHIWLLINWWHMMHSPDQQFYSYKLWHEQLTILSWSPVYELWQAGSVMMTYTRVTVTYTDKHSDIQWHTVTYNDTQSNSPLLCQYQQSPEPWA